MRRSTCKACGAPTIVCSTPGNPGAVFDAEPRVPTGRWRLTAGGEMVRDGQGHYVPHERVCGA